MHVSWCATSAKAWTTLVDLYYSQTQERSVNTRISLATMKKNHLSVSEYYLKMSQFADELVVSATPLYEDEFVIYLLTGLDEEYNPLFTAIVARVDPISPIDLYVQLLSFEQHTSL
jgi:hypothetical protein